VRHVGLGHVGELLARSEASASSLIEGYGPTPRSVAVADFTARGRDAAVTVARNLRAVRTALARSCEEASSVVRDALELQPLIARHEPGVRTGPVWIGGATPLEAHFVAAPHDRVPALLEDLEAYVASRRHPPLVAAALAHAQFETIHPFGDGNGRVGRVLIGTVLSRYGLTPGVVLPVSTELFRDRDRYYRALDAYRTDRGPAAIIRVLADAVVVGADDATALAAGVQQWETTQRALLEARQRAQSSTGRVRTGLAHRLIGALADHPVLAVSDVARREEVADNTARTALETLAEVGTLVRDRKTDRTQTLYVATGLLDLIAPPAPVRDEPVGVPRPVDGHGALPFEGGDACGAWLVRANRACRLPPGHRGQHR
jgi:Fic family protein